MPERNGFGEGISPGEPSSLEADRISGAAVESHGMARGTGALQVAIRVVLRVHATGMEVRPARAMEPSSGSEEFIYHSRQN